MVYTISENALKPRNPPQLHSLLRFACSPPGRKNKNGARLGHRAGRGADPGQIKSMTP
jgi:hypothetical protein